MGFNYLTVYGTSPELDPHLRRANEARAAVVHAAWKAGRRAVSGAVRALVEALDRARRAGRTSRALNALGDRQLHDIGLDRADIETVAEAVAAQGAGSGVTLEDLHRIGILDTAREKRRGVPLPAVDRRRRRLDPRRAGRPAAGATAAHHRVAG